MVTASLSASRQPLASMDNVSEHKFGYKYQSSLSDYYYSNKENFFNNTVQSKGARRHSMPSDIFLYVSDDEVRYVL